MSRLSILLLLIVSMYEGTAIGQLQSFQMTRALIPFQDSIVLGNAEYLPGTTNPNWNITQIANPLTSPALSVMDRVPDKTGWVTAMAVHPSGDLFAVGEFYPVDYGQKNLMVRQKKAGLAEWSTVDLIPLESTYYPSRDIAIDSRGNIFVLASTGQRNIVRLSRDRGVTWQTVDEITGGGWSKEFDAANFMIDSQDNVFVYASTFTGLYVRRGRAEGGWTTIDAINIPWSKGRASPFSIHQDSTGRIWTFGRMQNWEPSNTPSYKLLRYSDSHGQPGSWKDYIPLESQPTHILHRATGFWTDSLGHLFLATLDGRYLPTLATFTVLHRSDDGGKTWKVLTRFLLDRYTQLSNVKEGKNGILYGIVTSQPTDYKVDMKVYLTTSTDHGANWMVTLLSKGFFTVSSKVWTPSYGTSKQIFELNPAHRLNSEPTGAKP